MASGRRPRLFRHITGDSRAEVAGARADEQRVELVRPQVGRGQGPAQGRAGQMRRLAPKRGVQFVRREIEDVRDVCQGEMAGGDAAVAGEDGAQDQLGAPVEPLQRRRSPRAISQHCRWVT